MSENENTVAKLSPDLQLVAHERELEKMIRAYERMFGTIINGVYHEHCHSITYLKGRLDGIKHAMRVMAI